MKNDLYIGFATIAVSGICGMSWNVSPADTGGTSVHINTPTQATQLKYNHTVQCHVSTLKHSRQSRADNL
jgi:hypothetical protein